MAVLQTIERCLSNQYNRCKTKAKLRCKAKAGYMSDADKTTLNSCCWAALNVIRARGSVRKTSTSVLYAVPCAADARNISGKVGKEIWHFDHDHSGVGAVSP